MALSWGVKKGHLAKNGAGTEGAEEAEVQSASGIAASLVVVLAGSVGVGGGPWML